MIGGTELKVGIGDMKFSRGEGRIITYALGSCIGITFYDPVTRLGALLHIMLPAQFEGKDSNPFKFADSGIREIPMTSQVHKALIRQKNLENVCPIIWKFQ